MKTFAKLMGITLLGTVLLSAAACGERKGGTVYSVYAPDGAPALAMVNAIETGGEEFEFHVVDASTIQTYVTGESPKADFCVLPVNAASKLLGTGEAYQMLGTVTNGNMYFLSTEESTLTSENFTSLAGKTVGVVQLQNVPGLTLRVVLEKYEVGYQILENKDAERASDKVNLVAVEATDVTPAFGLDYYLCPEPAASTKIKGTANAPKPFQMAGDLQALYGGGYPQAVLVARSSLCGKQAVSTLITLFEGAEEYLKTATPEVVLAALDGKRTPALAPAFNANNLSAAVIQNCSVKFSSAKDCKAKVNAFLNELKGVNANAASAVADAFYYEG